MNSMVFDNIPHKLIAYPYTPLNIRCLMLICDEILRKQNLAVDLMQYRAAQDATVKEKGWPEMAYGASKVGVTLMTRIQQMQLAKDSSHPDIIVNSVSMVYKHYDILVELRQMQNISGVNIVLLQCCPGYVNTNLTSYKGHKTINQG